MRALVLFLLLDVLAAAALLIFIGRDRRSAHAERDALARQVGVTADMGAEEQEERFAIAIGDVSRLVPTTQFTAIGQGYSCGSHGWQCTTFSASSIGMKGMLYAGKVMASMACRLMNDPELVAAARKEFMEKTKGVRFVSSLPDDWKPGM